MKKKVLVSAPILIPILSADTLTDTEFRSHTNPLFLIFRNFKMKKLSGSSGRSLLLLITNITLMVLGAITVASGSILIAIFLLHLFTFASQVRYSPHYHLKVQANPPKITQKKTMLFLASMGETGLSHDNFL